MFGIGKKRKVRRQRAKQLKAETTPTSWDAFVRHVGLWPAAIAVLFFVLTLLVATIGERGLPYALNEKIDQPIVARVDFTVLDSNLAAQNEKAARESVPSHYRVNTELIERVERELSAMFEAAQRPTLEEFQTLAEKAVWPGEEAAYTHLHGADETRRDSFSRSLVRLRSALLREHTARPTALEERNPPSTAAEVLVLPAEPKDESKPEAEALRLPKVQLIQIASRDAVEGRAIKLAQNFDYNLAPAVRETLLNLLAKEPILVYDPQRTQEAMDRAAAAAPSGEVTYQRGKAFIFPHQLDQQASLEVRTGGLTSEELRLLEEEAAAYNRFLASDDPLAVKVRNQRLYARMGLGVVLAVLVATLFVYVGLYQRRIFEVRTRTIAFAGLLVLALTAARLAEIRLPHSHAPLLPILLAASILTIAYPLRFATGVTAIFVLVAGLLLEADSGSVLTMLIGGILTVSLLNDIRTRTRIVSGGTLSAALVFLLSFAFSLIDQQEVEFGLWRAGYGAAAALLSALILQAALPFVERVFKVATSLTLLEYRDANRPVLRRLAHEAPGTYNHSLVLGTMAEAACESIGANGLLAHVGALYHDIGKIPKAEYFAENQEASINRHDSLAPSMSLLIILGHVKDGLELAKEYGLPRVLHPFIAEHHGTTVVKYFHHVASEKQPQIASGKHDRQISEAEFRYPGPKPQSKETAVLMLCDGIETAVRSLNEPTAGRIESVVSQVLQARLKDGQFDDCDITLRELHRVEESLVKSLCRFYHGRVAYPKDAQKSDSPADEPRQDDATNQPTTQQLAG